MPFRVEFMNGQRGSYSRPPQSKPRDGGLFWWTIIITLLLAIAIASWLFSIYVFAYPEKPFNYRFLGRIDKLKPLTTYTLDKVPSGKTLGPKSAFEEFERLPDALVKAKSELFRRSYIQNYSDPEEQPVYLRGEYKIYQVRNLTSADVFPTGFVVRAQAIEKINEKDQEYPNTVLECIFPTAEAVSAPPVQVGDKLKLESKRTYASVLNIERLPDQKLLFTVVPLTYGEFEINKERDSKITLKPPARLNMDARWPLTDEGVGSLVEPTVAVEGISEAQVQ